MIHFLNFASLLTAVDSTWGALHASGRNIVDIALLAIIIYAIIQFFREAHLMPIAVGILTVVALYGTATVLDLPLTRLILRSFFGIFLILLAIIFQKELRRFFTLLGFFGALKNIIPPTDKAIEIISTTVAKFAKARKGAIIVFPGRESLGRQLEGGHLLRGDISEPLLFSIFDTSSPGHDGAIIIENNKIERFGVHLPLAEKMEKVDNFGLRHRAALGLVENSDAMVVVVSEEKASISVAWKGELHHVEDENELRKLIAEFNHAKIPGRAIYNYSNWFLQNVAVLGIAIVASLGIWFFVNSESQFTIVQRNFSVTPEFKNESNDYYIQKVSPEMATLTLEGRSIEFDSLRPESLKILLDVSDIKKEGKQEVVVAPENVKAPLNFSIIRINPPLLLLDIRKNASSTH